jgi:hypothetical protein
LIPDIKIFYWSPFSKWPPQYHKNSTSQFDMWVDYDVGNQFATSLSTHISNCDDIGQCWFFAISSQFNMWVDNDVPNWFPILSNFYWSPFSKWPPQYRKNSTLSFWKWRPVEICQCRESIQDIIIYPHMKFWWYRRPCWIFAVLCSWHWTISTGRHF